MEQKYIKECMEKGKLRISTLYKYHDLENLEVSIYDETEGNVTVYVENFVTGNEDVTIGNLYRGINSPDCTISGTQINDIPNSFITSFSQQGFMPFKSGLGFGTADSSMILDNSKIDEFMWVVGDKLIEQGYDVIAQRIDMVNYVEKDRKYEHQNPHIFYTDEFEKINAPIYTVQKEIRAVWRVNPIPQVDYIDIQDDRLKHCFRLP